MDILRRDPQQRSMKDTEQVINHFSKIDFFSSYTEEGCKLLLKSILEKATLYQFREGEFLYRKGDEASFIYIVMKGELGLYGSVTKKNVQSNQASLVSVFREGDCLGNLEMTLNINRIFTVEALTDGKLLKIDRVSFNKHLRNLENQKLDADFNFLENVEIFKGWNRDQLINIQIDCMSRKFKN